MKRGLRFTVSISSTSFWNSNLSSMVATGNSPPYGVRFLPSKSNGVEPAILLGSGVTAGGPCLERVLPLCFFSFFTFWVTSWKSAREARTSLPQSLFSSSNAVHRSGDNRNSGGSRQRAIECGDKRGHYRSRRRYFGIPLVLADRKKKRYQRHTVYHKSCGRRYRDRRK